MTQKVAETATARALPRMTTDRERRQLLQLTYPCRLRRSNSVGIRGKADDVAVLRPSAVPWAAIALPRGVRKVDVPAAGWRVSGRKSPNVHEPASAGRGRGVEKPLPEAFDLWPLQFARAYQTNH